MLYEVITYKVIFIEPGIHAFVLFQSNLPTNFGAIAQLEERLICIQEVVGSIPSGSTIFENGWCWKRKDPASESRVGRNNFV